LAIRELAYPRVVQLPRNLLAKQLAIASKQCQIFCGILQRCV